MVQSLLDNDLYKFTMMQTVLHHYPRTKTRYRFQCRTPGIDFHPFVKAVKQSIEQLCELHLTQDELNYLSQLSFFKEDFIDFLEGFRLNTKFITIKQDNDFELIIEGPWLQTILFEVPLLAIINEHFFAQYDRQQAFTLGKQRLQEKIDATQKHPAQADFKFSDFGTRRRFSFQWQDEVIKTLKQQLPQHFLGTSNLYFAKKYELAPIGTMAHEFIQAHQILAPNLLLSQRHALQVWAEEYRGELGIALTDTLTMEQFFKEYDGYLCRLFDGTRHDSGDPMEWADHMIALYKKHGIDPKHKKIVYSGDLTFPKALDLHDKLHQRIQPLFGIGTNLLNDTGFDALQIVIKLTACNDLPVAKLSENPAKHVCEDPVFLKWLKQLLHVN